MIVKWLTAQSGIKHAFRVKDQESLCRQVKRKDITHGQTVQKCENCKRIVKR